MIKLKDIIKEAKWLDRKWGDPLPTLEDVMKEADDDDAFVHVGGGTYKEKNRATGKPLPNSPSYIKKDGGGFEMVDDDDPRLSKGDDDEDDKEKPSGGDLDYSRDGEESDDEEGEPDFYDPEDYEKHYPEKTKPKDEVGGVKYGQGFSADSDHMFDSVADSPLQLKPDSGLLDAVKDGNWKKFRAGIHDIADQDAREHLLNLANHVDSGTYNDEFPKGKKGLEFGRKEVMDLFRQASEYGGEQWGGEEPSAKGGAVKDITKDMKSIPSSGGNNVLLHKNTEGHIARHNKPGEGSVFSKDVKLDDVKKAISEIPEEFYEKGGGVHTTTVPNAGYNLVQKSSDIEKNHPNAKKIMVKKQVGYDRKKNQPIMKEVPAYIIDGDKEDFKTDQLNVVVRPSNADFMDDEVKNNPNVKKDLDGGKSYSVLSSFPGDPDVPPAQEWEKSGHAIIIPNGGKDADKTNWVGENIMIKLINGKKYKAIKEAKKSILLFESKMEIRKMWDRIRIKEDYMTEADDDKKKEHDKGDVWKSEKTGKWQAIGPSGDQESFGDDKEAAEKHANPEEKGGEEKPKGAALGKGDFERDGGEPEDKPHGGDTGKDADFKGEPPEGAREPDDDEGGGEDGAGVDAGDFEKDGAVDKALSDESLVKGERKPETPAEEAAMAIVKDAIENDIITSDPSGTDVFYNIQDKIRDGEYERQDFVDSLKGEKSDDEEGEPDFYDPEDYEKHYPEKTKPKDEVGGVKYGQGFSADSDHMFDSVADSPLQLKPDSGLLDAVKDGNWKKFRAGIHDIADQDAREHLLNLANHVDSGTYNDEFPKGKKGLEFGRKEVMDLFRQASEYGGEQWGGEEPSAKGGAVKDITKDMKSIPSSGGNNVLLHKNTEGHIARHNKPGEGSVFSKDVKLDDVKKAISEIPEEFYEKGGGVHTTTVPNAGYNLVQKSSDIEKNHPNAKKIMVKKQVGYDRKKNQPIMKEVPAYIIDGDKEDFKTDQLNVVVRPSNADFMDDEVKNNPNVKKDLDGGKSYSVLSSFPGDPDVPPAQEWEKSGHAIIIPNGGKDADKTNWVGENIMIKLINGKKYKAIKEAKKSILLFESKMEIRKMWDRIRIKEDYMTEADDDKKKEHDKGDVWKSEKTGKWQAIGPSGDQESFGDDKEAAEKHANPEEKGGEEKPKGAALGKGDFERDGGEPEDKPHGGDTGKDADFKGEPPEGAREPESGEPESTDREIKFAGPVPTDKELDQLSNDELETEHENTRDEMEELDDYIGMAKDDLEMADDEEEKERLEGQVKDLEKERYSLNIKSSRISQKIKGDSDKKPSGGMIGSLGHRGRMDRTGTEEIKIINGKKYKAIKEAKKPTLLFESKMEIRKMWDRIK